MLGAVRRRSTFRRINWDSKSAGTYGENLQILIQGIDGTIKATWITAWLKDNLQLQNAGIVDLIALTFLGKREVELGVNITPTH